MHITQLGCWTMHRALVSSCLSLTLCAGLAAARPAHAAPTAARPRPAPPPPAVLTLPPLPMPPPPLAAAPAPSPPPEAVAAAEAEEPPVDELTGRFRDLEQRIEQTREMITARRPTVTIGGY